MLTLNLTSDGAPGEVAAAVLGDGATGAAVAESAEGEQGVGERVLRQDIEFVMAIGTEVGHGF